MNDVNSWWRKYGAHDILYPWHKKAHTLSNLMCTDSSTCVVYMTKDWLSHYKSATPTSSLGCKQSHAYRTKQRRSTDTHSQLDSYGYKLVKPLLLYVFNSRSNFLIIFHCLFCILLLFAPHQSRGKWLYMDVSQMILFRIHPYVEKMTGKEGQGLKRLE